MHAVRMLTYKWNLFVYFYTACGPPPEVTDGTYGQSYNATANSTVTYTCQPGYYMTGAEYVTCKMKTDQTAAWTDPPRCRLCKYRIFYFVDIFSE